MVSGHLNAPLQTLSSRRVSRAAIGPSGIARQDSRNCYFIVASVGTREGSLHFIPGGSAAIATGGRSLGREHFYHSISEAQFKWMESGAILASSIFVLDMERPINYQQWFFILSS